MRTEQKINLMFDIAKRYALEATCPRMQGGAVIATPDYHVVTSGYNGAPRGLPQCNESSCLLIDGHCARARHSERNAIIQAARIGVSIEGRFLYCTHFPCPTCAGDILQAGIQRIMYLDVAPTYNENHRTLVEEWCEHLRVPIVRWTFYEPKLSKAS